MNDEDAFLEALRSDPSDGTFLLVYADWLQERGDPRAEYIRLTQTPQENESRIQDLRRQLAKDWVALIDSCETPIHELRLIDQVWRSEKAQLLGAIGRPNDRSTLQTCWELVLSIFGVVSGVGLSLLAFWLSMVREQNVGAILCGTFFFVVSVFSMSVLWLTEVRYFRAWRAYRRRRALARSRQRRSNE
jgi:uncharacterized protein (TIGR02996 family)